MKNYIDNTFLITLWVVALLLLLHHLPAIDVFGNRLRRVDLLSDVRSEKPNNPPAHIPHEDSLGQNPPTEIPETSIAALPEPEVPAVWVDTCRAGLTCIEDYADSTLRGMKPFYDALNKRQSLRRPVRIAFFGDSFIEGDILTADLRSLLQAQYGGCGVGFVPTASKSPGFRKSVEHYFDGWSEHYHLDTVNFSRAKQGIAACYFEPGRDAFVELRGHDKYAPFLDTCQVSTIYFGSDGVVEMESVINREQLKVHHSHSRQYVQQLQVEGNINTIRWTVRNAANAIFYGVAMDGKEGIALDNFSLRGSSGLNLRGLPEKTIRQFNQLRPYDLVVVQYGLNVATPRGANYESYKKGMTGTIEHLKKCFPQAGILLLSVGDRNQKDEYGELRTMPGVKNLIKYQRAIAEECHIAFWNLYQGMGGEGSIARLAQAKPPQANLDYTHINFLGGKTIADILYNTLLYGKEQYDRREEYAK